ncbi:MAG: sulfite exporter TauE/SafE family protein [Gemmatimonadales bacterium]
MGTNQRPRRQDAETPREAAMTWIWVTLLGLVAGVVSGLFGVGGAIVIVPGLVLIAHLDQHTAHGTSLAALVLPAGILVGALEYYRRGQVNIPYAAVIAGGLLVGALIGAKLAVGLPEVVLRRAFGAFLLLVSVRLLLG